MSPAGALAWSARLTAGVMNMSTVTDKHEQLPSPPVQRIIKVRCDNCSWVSSETMEDYALRFKPQRFRKWSEWRAANTAFGAECS